MKPWTTKEDAAARRAYYLGGTRAACAILPHRTASAISSRARSDKWPYWIAVTPGTVYHTALEMAKDGPITSRDLADHTGSPVKNAAAVLCNMLKLGLVERDKLEGTSRYLYRPSRRYIEAKRD